MAGITGFAGNKDVYPELLDSMFMLKHRGNDYFKIAVGKERKESKRIKELQDEFISGRIGIACNANIEYKDKKDKNNSESELFELVFDGNAYNFGKGKVFDFFDERISSLKRGKFEKLERNEEIERIIYDFLKEANGEFAGLLKVKNSVYGFRDILGIKPLWFDSNSFGQGISSETRSLKKLNMHFPKPLKPGKIAILNLNNVKNHENKIVEKKTFSLKDLRENLPKKTSVEDIKEIFLDAVNRKTKERNGNTLKKAGIFFSAGVDSTVIAKAVSEKIKKTVLYTVGYNESEDIKYARKIAKETGLDLELKIVKKGSRDELKDYLLKALKTLGFFDQMQLEIGVVEYIAGELAKKNKTEICFSGQGSDELFAGYSSYKEIFKKNRYNGVEEEIWRTLNSMWSRNFIRDDLMSSIHGIETRMPYLDIDFLKHAMALHPKHKILSENDELRKHAVREIGKDLGVPELAYKRKKKAMQYGSGIGKELRKIL